MVADAPPSQGRSTKEIRVAIVNRHDAESFDVPILFGPACELVGDKIKVYEVWGESLGDSNGFDEEKVKTVEKEVEFHGLYHLKKHSFQSKMRFALLNSDHTDISLVLVFTISTAI